MKRSLLPSAPDRELQVCSALVYAPQRVEAYLPSGFGEGEFYSPAAAAVWRAYESLRAQGGGQIGALDFAEQLEKRDGSHFAAAGGVWAYLSSLRDLCPTLEILPGAVEALAAMSLRRRVHAAATRAQCSAVDLTLDAQDLAGHALAEMTDATQRRDSSKIPHPKEALRAVFAEMDRTHGQAVQGLASGIDALDALTGGFRDGELVTIAGPSGGGKSALMTQMVVDSDLPALLFSLEMPAAQCWERLLVQRAKINAGHLRARRLERAEWVAMYEAATYFEAGPIRIAKGANWSAEAIFGETVRWRIQTGWPAAVVVVDYLQLVETAPMRGGRGTREEEIAQVIRRLKMLADRAKCPVLTASQLNDDGQVRESRRIEQDSDYLLVIRSDDEAEDERDLILQKARSAPRGSGVRTKFDGAKLRFYQRGDGAVPRKPARTKR